MIRRAPRWLAMTLVLGMAACGVPAQQTVSEGASMRIADAALASGSPTVALQVLEATLKSEPNNAEALLRQGKAQLMMGNAAAAEASFRRAVAANGALVDAQTSLGKVLLDRNPAAAEPIFAALVAKDPANFAAANNLGVSRDLQGKHAQAQLAYRQALATSPELASARQNLALSLAVSGRASEGVTMLSEIASTGIGGRKARDNLAVALVLAGETAQANQVLREELSPADAEKAIDGYRGLGAPATP